MTGWPKWSGSLAEKGLVRRRDGDESDVFVLFDAEDLLRILDSTGARKHVPLTVYRMSIGSLSSLDLVAVRAH